MIKVVLFDFYGVFMTDPYNLWLKKNNLKREGDFASLINELDKGNLKEVDFLKELSRAIGRKVTIDEIHYKGAKPNAYLIEYTRSLKSKYKICLFSNASPKLRAKLEHWEMTDLFDELIISSEIGHAKPSDEAFAIAIEQVGALSKEILFIDDNPKNIEAGLRNNLLTHTYVSAARLRNALKMLN